MRVEHRLRWNPEADEAVCRAGQREKDVSDVTILQEIKAIRLLGSAALHVKNYNQTLKELKSHFSERRTAALVYKLEICMMQLVQIMHKVTELTDKYQKKDTEKWGQPIISVERFIDEYNSRNSSLADLMRRLGICEELGSGLDKAVAAIELFQLPPLRFTVQEARTTVTLFAYRKYADLDRQERIYACYQHACLKYVTNDKMTNLTLREHLGIDKQNYPMASRIIKDTLIAGKIKEEKTENQSRNNKGYVPF